MMTPNRRKSVVVLTTIVCVSAAILTGCGAETAMKSVWNSATKCPEYDGNGYSLCLRRVCKTEEGRRKYDADCDKLRKADRRNIDNQTDDNPTGK